MNLFMVLVMSHTCLAEKQESLKLKFLTILRELCQILLSVHYTWEKSISLGHLKIKSQQNANILHIQSQKSRFVFAFLFMSKKGLFKKSVSFLP